MKENFVYFIWGDVFNFYKCVFCFFYKSHHPGVVCQSFVLGLAVVPWGKLPECTVKASPQGSPGGAPVPSSALGVLSSALGCRLRYDRPSAHILTLHTRPARVWWFKHLLDSCNIWYIFLAQSLVEKSWFPYLGFPACCCDCLGMCFFNVSLLMSQRPQSWQPVQKCFLSRAVQQLSWGLTLHRKLQRWSEGVDVKALSLVIFNLGRKPDRYNQQLIKLIYTKSIPEQSKVTNLPLQFL